MKLVNISAAALLMIAVPTMNQATARDWDLQECIDYAIENNIDVKLQQQSVRNGELQISESRNAFLPQVNGSVSESFNFGRGLTSQNTYANRNTSSLSMNLSLSVPIFSGLRNSRNLQQAKLNLRQLAWQLEQTRDNVTLNVIAQYLQVLYNKEVMETSQAQVDLSKHELERRRTLADEGKIAEIEVLEAESQLAKDKLTLVNAGNDYRLALLELTQLLQLESPEGFDIVALDGEDPVIPAASVVYESALCNYSGLKAAEAQVDVAQSAIKVAQTGYIPTLSLGGGVGTSYYKLNGTNNLPFKTQMRENYSTYIGISLNIPIFDALNTPTAVKRARVQYLSAQLQSDQVRSDLYKTIQQVHVQATGARDKYETAITTCRAAEISFEAMSQKYNLGRATSTEYEQSKTNLFSARIQQLQARYEYLLRYRILRFYQH
ncbi:MAG: TolC family protein [Clostridiales bacterium]|nr:TolC family protein [Clostridiales bacterium]